MESPFSNFFCLFCLFSIMQIMPSPITKIEPVHPGYMWHYTLGADNEISVELRWTPLSGIYSPPLFETGIYMLTLAVPKWFPTGLLIGKNGVHFKAITENTGCHYLFVRHGVIEIWGTGVAPTHALQALQQRAVHVHVQSLSLPRIPGPCWEGYKKCAQKMQMV
uniref:K Homology domain-containing protein n=1 Tax=viral metagenome TaxID=1070528 RepID=A0A6C0K5U5_9ZZZZ